MLGDRVAVADCDDRGRVVFSGKGKACHPFFPRNDICTGSRYFTAHSCQRNLTRKKLFPEPFYEFLYSFPADEGIQLGWHQQLYF